MKRFFLILVLFSILILLTNCMIYPIKSKTYLPYNSYEDKYGIEFFLGIHGCAGNAEQFPPYRLAIGYNRKQSICKVITFEEVIVNKGKNEYRNSQLFSSADSEYSSYSRGYDLPKEFNLDDMDDKQDIYISLKVKFELSDGQIKEEWLGFIVTPKLKTQWINPLFSV